jgi:hypothetical protein
MHIVDFDVRSSCNLFTDCLAELRRWSDAHPDHEPIFILLEAKSDPIPIFPGSKPPCPSPPSPSMNSTPISSA